MHNPGAAEHACKVHEYMGGDYMLCAHARMYCTQVYGIQCKSTWYSRRAPCCKAKLPLLLGTAARSGVCKNHVQHSNSTHLCCLRSTCACASAAYPTCIVGKF